MDLMARQLHRGGEDVLGPPERARLASDLPHGLEAAERDADAAAAWTAELDRRLDDVRSGRVGLVDLNEVKRRMAERRARRAASRVEPMGCRRTSHDS